MRKSIGVFAAFVLGLLSYQSAKADTCNNVVGNRVANCGFETGDLTGWTNTPVSGQTSTQDQANSVTNNPNVQVYSGTYAAQIGGFGGDEALSQTFSTIVGGIYTIQFSLANEGGTPNDLSVVFGGVTLFTESNASASGYRNPIYSYTLAATNANSTLSFLARNDELYFDLDSVSVVGPVPEPSSLVLLGTGVLGLAGAARRRFVR